MNNKYFHIGKIFIDFRKWYQVWTPKGKDMFEPEFDGWSSIWYSEGEIEDWLEENPNLKYRKMNFFHHNFLHNKHYIVTFLKYALVLLTGFIIGKIL